MMKTILIGLMVMHGIAHSAGFAGAWQLSAKIPYKTTVLFGRLDLGHTGIRVLGILWLLAAVAFVISAAAAAASYRAWTAAALIVALSSAALCFMELPQAKIGLFVNALIIAAVLAGLKLELLP